MLPRLVSSSPPISGRPFELDSSRVKVSPDLSRKNAILDIRFLTVEKEKGHGTRNINVQASFRATKARNITKSAKILFSGLLQYDFTAKRTLELGAAAIRNRNIERDNSDLARAPKSVPESFRKPQPL